MNGMGFSPYSDVLTILSCRTPLLMTVPFLGFVDWNVIRIFWSPLVSHEDTGRALMTYYKVEYDDGVPGTGWVEVSIDTNVSTTDFNHTLAVPFPANRDRTPYYVKYRVTGKNAVGLGIINEEWLTVETDTYPI